jgi:hypothetical protein
MKEFLSNQYVLKAIAVVGSVGIYVIGHYLPDIADELNPMAGLLIGWLGMRRPGDSK